MMPAPCRSSTGSTLVALVDEHSVSASNLADSPARESRCVQRADTTRNSQAPLLAARPRPAPSCHHAQAQGHPSQSRQARARTTATCAHSRLRGEALSRAVIAERSFPAWRDRCKGWRSCRGEVLACRLSGSLDAAGARAARRGARSKRAGMRACRLGDENVCRPREVSAGSAPNALEFARML